MESYIDAAIEEAFKSDLNNRHGCVIVYKNKIIGSGHNEYKKSGKIIGRGQTEYVLTKTNEKQSIHAEEMAILDCVRKYRNWRKLLEEAILIVVRLPCAKTITINDTTYINCVKSDPCEHCSKILAKHNITNIIHS